MTFWAARFVGSIGGAGATFATVPQLNIFFDLRGATENSILPKRVTRLKGRSAPAGSQKIRVSDVRWNLAFLVFLGLSGALIAAALGLHDFLLIRDRKAIEDKTDLK